MNVRFCSSCRALILSGYRYCPYCGLEATRGPGIEEALDPPFMRIQAEREGGRSPADGPAGASSAEGAAASARGPDPAAARFAAAREELGRLEAEMECLIEGEGGRQCTGR